MLSNIYLSVLSYLFTSSSASYNINFLLNSFASTLLPSFLLVFLNFGAPTTLSAVFPTFIKAPPIPPAIAVLNIDTPAFKKSLEFNDAYLSKYYVNKSSIRSNLTFMMFVVYYGSFTALCLLAVSYPDDIICFDKKIPTGYFLFCQNKVIIYLFVKTSFLQINNF